MGFVEFVFLAAVVVVLVVRSEAAKPRTFMSKRKAAPKDVPPPRSPWGLG